MSTVYINRVQTIPTSDSEKGIYLYVDPNTQNRSIYVVANAVVTDMLLNRVTHSELSEALSNLSGSDEIQQLLLNYVKTEDFQTTLSDYIKTEDFQTTLLDYVTGEDFQNVLSDYVTNDYFNNALLAITQVLETKTSVADVTSLIENKVSIETVNELIEQGLQGVISSSIVDVNGTLYLVDTAQKILDLTGSAYSSENPTLQKIGGLEKGTSYSIGTTILGILNSMFFPNIGKEFPEKPVFIGFTETYPNVSKIITLNTPQDFYEFDYTEYTNSGYVVIALPATLYLKRIEDENGLNIVNGFELIYKSIWIDPIYDIYNVYVSPKLNYGGDELSLTLTSKTGDPVQATLNDVEFLLDELALPILSSISVKEIVRSVLNSINVSEESILTDVTVSEIERSILTSFSIAEAIRSKLIKLDVSELSNLSEISVVELQRSELLNLEVQGFGSRLVDLTVSEYSDLLHNIEVSELTKSNILETIVNPILRSQLLDINNITEITRSVLKSTTLSEESILNELGISELNRSNLQSIEISQNSILHSLVCEELTRSILIEITNIKPLNL